MKCKLGSRSRSRLVGVHSDLVLVVGRAIQLTELDFTVLEGRRSLARQKKLVARGASKTMNSRHLTGHAVDLGALEGGEVSWHWPYYDKIHAAMKQASRELGIPIQWGGHFRSFPDGPHFQLPRREYPA